MADRSDVPCNLAQAFTPEKERPAIPNHVLARLALLSGDAEPCYAEADIGHDYREGGLTGQVVLITDDLVVTARLMNVTPVTTIRSAPGEPGGATIIESWARSSLVGLGYAESTDALINEQWHDEPAALPPSSRIKLTYRDGQRLELPLDKFATVTKRQQAIGLLPAFREDLIDH